MKPTFATLTRAGKVQHNTHRAETCQGENGEHNAREAGENEPVRVYEAPEGRTAEREDAGE